MKNKSTLLISKDDVLIVRTDLAVIIGLNESIVLNQIEYWLKQKRAKNENYIDGRYWVYNSFSEWQKQFPFWSERTLKRIFSGLENNGLLLVGNYNKMKMDRTKWYTIDYDELSRIEQEFLQIEDNDSTIVTKWHDGKCQNDPTNTKDYTKTTYNKLNTFSSENATLSAKQLNTFPQETPFNFSITRNHIISVMKEFGYDSDSNETTTAIEVFQFYYAQYKNKTGLDHPKLNTKTMKSVLENFLEGSEMVDSGNRDVLTYQAMIEQHFTKNYGMDVDWNIQHFMTEGIRNCLFYQACY